jgi:cytochrome b pre-mRNA-processing protein 3
MPWRRAARNEKRHQGFQLTEAFSMIWSRLFAPKRESQRDAAVLYRAIVAQARQPVFYTAYGVPDSVDGRFELLSLHMFTVLHRLKSGAPEARELGQTLFDTMFGDMDRSLREMGAGDLGVGKRVRAMAEGLYGRMAAYEAGLTDEAAMTAALRRNLYGTLRDREPAVAALQGLGTYLRASVERLASCPVDQLAAGNVTFPDVPPV